MACVCIVLEDNNVVVHNKGMVGRNDSGWRWGLVAQERSLRGKGRLLTLSHVLIVSITKLVVTITTSFI